VLNRPPMRAWFVSDLHVDICDWNTRLVDDIVDAMMKDTPDVLVCCGDICVSELTFRNVLAKFEHIDIPKLFVPGNHDVWLRKRDVFRCRKGWAGDSWKKLELLSDICDSVGWKPLMSGPVIIDDVAFVGTMGWYDYSFRDEHLKVPIESYEAKGTTQQYWNDGIFACFYRNGKQDTDYKITEILNGELEKHLIEARGRKIIACTHMIPFKELQGDMHRDGSFFNAFGGNATMGDLLVEHGVSVSVSGHLHRNFHRVVRGIDCYQTSVGYLHTETGYDADAFLSNRTLLLDL